MVAARGPRRGEATRIDTGMACHIGASQCNEMNEMKCIVDQFDSIPKEHPNGLHVDYSGV